MFGQAAHILIVINIANKLTTTNYKSMANLFSFNGRIRRSDYGLTVLIFLPFSYIINELVKQEGCDYILLKLAFIPMYWILWAQGAKRCHDLGNNGWFQLIPFYIIFMLFVDSIPGANQYGNNPKEKVLFSKNEVKESNEIEKES